jgi:hypothetical protein
MKDDDSSLWLSRPFAVLSRDAANVEADDAGVDEDDDEDDEDDGDDDEGDAGRGGCGGMSSVSVVLCDALLAVRSLLPCWRSTRTFAGAL